MGDPGQAKLRLFEAVVALLALAARDQGLLLIVDATLRTWLLGHIKLLLAIQFCRIPVVFVPHTTTTLAH